METKTKTKKQRAHERSEKQYLREIGMLPKRNKPKYQFKEFTAPPLKKRMY